MRLWGTPPFLLTRPLRDVTTVKNVVGRFSTFLLTRPLRDVTCQTPFWQNLFLISTHTPLAGRDDFIGNKPPHSATFLLTRPLRDVTFLLSTR